jgi:hypothetical protein
VQNARRECPVVLPAPALPDKPTVTPTSQSDIAFEDSYKLPLMGARGEGFLVLALDKGKGMAITG